ncbi:hypothetical protein HZS_7170 [Henneguya salminicola]|nr:hypothetical protein HZS_7170 [Henneguya salminicola]
MYRFLCLRISITFSSQIYSNIFFRIYKFILYDSGDIYIIGLHARSNSSPLNIVSTSVSDFKNVSNTRMPTKRINAFSSFVETLTFAYSYLLEAEIYQTGLMILICSFLPIL